MIDNREDRSEQYWIALARMGFEEELHRLLEAKGVSQTALAQAIGTTRPYISQVLNGVKKNFTLRTMVKIARALDAAVEVRLVVDEEEIRRMVEAEMIRNQAVRERDEFERQRRAAELEKHPEAGSKAELWKRLRR